MRASDAADLQSDLDETTALHASCEVRFANTSAALNAASAARTALQVSLAHETASLTAKGEALATSVARATTAPPRPRSTSWACSPC